MRRVIFSRMRPAGGRWNVSGRGCACRPVIGASPGCYEQWGAPDDTSRQSGLRAELPPIRHHHKPRFPSLADSLACDAIPQFDAHRLECRLALLRLPAPPRPGVTLALHACNGKKILTRKRPSEASIIRNFGCNVCQSHSIFSENASVSYAVDSSFDRMMLNRNRTTNFPHWLTFVGALALVRTRSQSALRPHAGQVSAL